ncbi:MAG: peptidylprolyl isomerase [Planctomycetota bacterium]
MTQCRCMLMVLILSSTSAMAQDNTAPANPLEKFPKVVAVVDGQTISRDQLSNECLKRYGTVVLDNLLNKQLILQACKAKGITITQADVNKEVERVANKVGLDMQRFLTAIEEERDITPEQYASEIVWPMLALRALASDQIQVTKAEVEQIIQGEYGPKVQVRMIAVSQKEKADQIYKAAMAAPDTFRRLAKEYSEDAASAAVDGLLPPVRRNKAKDPLERVAFQLQPAEISPVFQIGDMHLIVQCVRHLAATPPSPDMMPMIQERITEQLRDQRLGSAADGIFVELQKNAEVVTVLGNPEYEQKYKGVAAYINRQPLPLTYLAAECMARHGKEILRGEISRYLLNTNLKKKNKSVEQADIDREVAIAAESEGFLTADLKPDVSAWLKSILEQEGATVELYVSDAVWPSVALKKLVEDTVEITDEDLQKGFENNFGPRAEVLACVLSNQRAAEDVFREARNKKGEQQFGELAAKYSVEPISRSNFGKIPAIRRHSGNPTLEEAAFSLQPGEISGILVWKDQYAILYKQGETTPIVKEFEAVREELTREIRGKKTYAAMHKYMDEMLKTAQIDNFLEGTTQSGKVVPASGTQAQQPGAVVPR